MKLSEAIRRGMKGTTQTFGVYFNGTSSCDALGAAMRGENYAAHNVCHYLNERRHGLCKIMACPESCGIKTALQSILLHLNDDHKWTREKIAGWLEEHGL